LTNIERTYRGLNPLKENKLLSEAARLKAGDMYAFNYWAHISPSGRTPWAFFNDVGYKYQYAGENLARDFKDPDSVVRAWMNSPSHKENVVNSKYQEIGVAVVDGTLQGVETTLVVQLFGTQFNSLPAKKAPEKTAKTPEVKPAVEVREAEVKQVLPKQESNESLTSNSNVSPLSNPLDITKIATILIVGILLGVFIADILIVSQKHTPRFSSKSLAQMMFLIFILILGLFVKEGAIL